MSPALAYLGNRCRDMEIELQFFEERCMIESTSIRRNKIAILKDVIEAITSIEKEIEEMEDAKP